MSDTAVQKPNGGKPRQSTLSAILAYTKPKALLMLALGFASGLPFLLVFDTLSAWLRDVGVSLQVIGFFVLATFSYTLKFMWAPVIDRINLPVLTPLLGHRRSWMLTMQSVVILGLWLIAGTNPATHLGQMAFLATLTAFFSATQDIVMDAWRIEAVDGDEDLQGVMVAAYQWGYRLAMIVAGMVPLLLAHSMGWHFSYALMAVFMSVGIGAVLLAPREAVHKIRPIHYEGMTPRPWLEALEWTLRILILILAALVMGSGLTGKPDLLNGLFGVFGMTAENQAAFASTFTSKSTGVFIQLPAFLLGFGTLIGCCLPLPWATRPGAYFRGAFIEPMVDFFRRYKDWAGFIFGLICVYRVSEFVLSIMNPFYLDIGFPLETVGEMRKVFGVVMLMIGVGLAGWIIARFSLMRALLIGAIVGPFSHIGFMWLTMTGNNVAVLAIALAMDNVAASISGTVLIAYMSSLVSQGYTASQYAIFSSFYALLGKLIASQSGRIVEASAKAADAGGFSSIFKGLMNNLTPGAYVAASQKLGVSAAAMGAGYFAFFAYTIVIGLAAIGLTFWLYLRRKEPVVEA